MLTSHLFFDIEEIFSLIKHLDSEIITSKELLTFFNTLNVDVKYEDLPYLVNFITKNPSEYGISLDFLATWILPRSENDFYKELALLNRSMKAGKQRKIAKNQVIHEEVLEIYRSLWEKEIEFFHFCQKEVNSLQVEGKWDLKKLYSLITEGNFIDFATVRGLLLKYQGFYLQETEFSLLVKIFSWNEEIIIKKRDFYSFFHVFHAKDARNSKKLMNIYPDFADPQYELLRMQEFTKKMEAKAKKLNIFQEAPQNISPNSKKRKEKCKIKQIPEETNYFYQEKSDISPSKTFASYKEFNKEIYAVPKDLSNWTAKGQIFSLDNAENSRKLNDKFESFIIKYKKTNFL